jgi:hypothetical protein
LCREPVELELVVRIEGGAELVDSALPLVVEPPNVVMTRSDQKEGRIAPALG